MKRLLLFLLLFPVYVEAQVPDNDGEYTLTFPMGEGIDEYALDDVEFDQDFGYYPDFYELTVKARSRADSVIFDHYGPEHFERYVGVPDSGFVYDTLHTSRIDTIRTVIRAYHDGNIYSTRRTYKYADHFWAVAQKKAETEDNMSQYYTDFSGYATGSQPSDWTTRWDGGTSWLVQSLGGATGGQVLEFGNESSNGRYLLSWDEIDSDANREDVEILIRHQTTGFNDFPNPVARGSGVASSETGYRSGLRYSSDNQRLTKYVNANFTSIAEETRSLSNNTWYWTRMRINGTTLSIKSWLDTDSEPASWDLSVTDSEISGAGWVGVFFFVASNDQLQVDIFSVGTGGDTAPSSDPGGTTALSGSIDSQAIASANLSQSSALAGNSLNSLSITGNTLERATLSGESATESALSASAKETGTLSGGFQSESTITGNATETSTLSGGLDTESIFSGSLIKKSLLSGGFTTQSTLSGNVIVLEEGITNLSGSIDTESNLSGNLSLTKQIQGIIESQTNLSGDVIKGVTLSGNTLTVSSLSADSSITNTLSGTMVVSSSLTGSLTPAGSAWKGEIDITNSPLYSISFSVKPMYSITITDSPLYKIKITDE